MNDPQSAVFPLRQARAAIETESCRAFGQNRRMDGQSLGEEATRHAHRDCGKRSVPCALFRRMTCPFVPYCLQEQRRRHMCCIRCHCGLVAFIGGSGNGKLTGFSHNLPCFSGHNSPSSPKSNAQAAPRVRLAGLIPPSQSTMNRRAGSISHDKVTDRIHPQPQKKFSINPYPLLDPGQCSDHDSREQIQRETQQALNSAQTGLHGSSFESLPELYRVRWRSFGARRAELGWSGDGTFASARVH